MTGQISLLDKFNRLSRARNSYLDFTFSINPYNKNSALLDSKTCSKESLFSPLCSTTLELEITMLEIKMNESFSLKENIIK